MSKHKKNPTGLEDDSDDDFDAKPRELPGMKGDKVFEVVRKEIILREKKRAKQPQDSRKSREVI